MDDDLTFGSEHETNRGTKKQALPHSKTVLFHCGFRFGSILLYFMSNTLSVSFVTTFIFTLLLLSADFWTVKNVSGRLLVGLRWWNEVDEEGNSKWIFESRSQKSLQRNPINGKESTIFWFTLFFGPAYWLSSLFYCFMTLSWKWIPLILIALSLTGANLIGYLRCKFSGTQQLSQLANQYMAASMIKNVVGKIPGFGGKSQQNDQSNGF